MNLKKFIIITLPLFNIGCSAFGPDYVKPEVDAPQKWAHAESSVSSSPVINLSDTSWWEKFNDQTLNSLIQEALTKNNNIQIAIGNIGVAEAQLKQVYMSWVPTIHLGGAILTGQLFNFSSNSSQPLLNNSNVVPNNTSFTFYEGGLVPVYSLNIFKQIKARELAKANVNNAKYAKDAVRLAIISQVAGSYFSLLALDQQKKEQQLIVDDLSEVVRLAKIQYNEGYAALTDIQPYQEQLEKAKMELPQIQNNIVHTQNALQALLGKNPGDITRNNTFSKIDTNGKIPVNLPSTVLLNRPDILQAEEQLKMANADIGYAKANYFPNISITSPVGAFSSQLTGLFNPSSNFWFTQIGATMPILNLGLNSLIKEKKAKYYIAYYNYIQTVKGSFAEVDNSLSSMAKLKDVYSNADQKYKIAKENAKLNQDNYKLGYISYPESLSSKINANSNKLMLTQVKLQQIQAIIKAYQAMAGGYNYKNTELPHVIDDDHDYQ